jgi:hypothetical protein
MTNQARQLNWESWQPRLLRGAVALCFFCHGYWALKNATIYHSEWNVWIQRLFPASPYVAARHFLTTVGTIDIVAALFMLLRQPPRLVYAWVIPWGTATALSRAYFLGSLEVDIWQGAVAPLAEVLARVVNFGVPLLAWQLVHAPATWSRRLPEPRQLYTAMVAASLAAVALRYLTDYLGPEYPFKLYKLGQSPWSFHAAGLAAWAAALAWLVAATYARGKTMATAVTLLVVTILAWHETLNLVYQQWPRGFDAMWISVGEHAPRYMALAGWLAWRTRPAASTTPCFAPLGMTRIADVS